MARERKKEKKNKISNLENVIKKWFNEMNQSSANLILCACDFVNWSSLIAFQSHFYFKSIRLVRKLLFLFRRQHHLFGTVLTWLNWNPWHYTDVGVGISLFIFLKILHQTDGAHVSDSKKWNWNSNKKSVRLFIYSPIGLSPGRILVNKVAEYNSKCLSSFFSHFCL